MRSEVFLGLILATCLAFAGFCTYMDNQSKAVDIGMPSASERIVGEIVYLGAQNPPVGWLVCDGKTYYVAQYQKLGRVLGSKFGGDGRYTFAVPKVQIADGTAVIDGMIAYEGKMPLMRRVPELPVYRKPKK